MSLSTWINRNVRGLQKEREYSNNYNNYLPQAYFMKQGNPKLKKKKRKKWGTKRRRDKEKFVGIGFREIQRQALGRSHPKRLPI